MTRLCRTLGLATAALTRLVAHIFKGHVAKLGLMAVLASEKRLLVLNEPLSGLDPKACILVKRELERSMQMAARCTIAATCLLTCKRSMAVWCCCTEAGLLYQVKLLSALSFFARGIWSKPSFLPCRLLDARYVIENHMLLM